MTNDQLIDALKSEGLLSADAAAKLKREVLVSGRAPEEIIYERRAVDDARVAEVKSRLLNVPYQKIDPAGIGADLMALIPEETVRAYGVAPLAKQDGAFIAGMLHPDDLKAQEALKFIAQRAHLNLGVYLLSYSDWQAVLAKYSPYKSQVQAAVRSLNLKPEEAGRKVVRLDEGAAGGEAPIIKIVTDTFTEAVRGGASDIHIEPQENYLRVRFRVDGELKEVASLPVVLAQAVVSRIKVISNLKIDENRIPQGGRFRANILGREIDFRIATFPTPLGEKVAIRVLDPSTGLKSFDRLGLAGGNLAIVKEGIEKPFGMVLITGPTGSGKTTTLYALLQLLNKESVNIVSLEDPVEYFVSGINQSQVHPEIGYDFASGLRQILRQDPDVIMVGEIRDLETAALAVQAALTGHIVLSTLHTNNAIGVIPRLLDMKTEPFLLPASLNLMMGQRLVGLLCPDCKESGEAPPELQKVIKKSLADVASELKSKYKEPYLVYHGKGCDKCKGRGTRGRMALFEVFRMTPELENVILSGPTSQKILAEAKRQGMLTMRQDGVLKALDGLVSLEEVVGETEDM